MCSIIRTGKLIGLGGLVRTTAVIGKGSLYGKLRIRLGRSQPFGTGSSLWSKTKASTFLQFKQLSITILEEQFAVK